MSTLEIADLLEELDDSDVDPDYENSSSSSSSDEENEAGAATSGGEHRVFIEPPVERPDAETDHDSGAKKFFYCKCLKWLDKI